MIKIKTPEEIELMRRAGAIVAQTLDFVGQNLRAGMTTGDVDKLVEDNILAAGAKPAFKGYRGFPASACVSIDEEVVHGIPGSRRLQDGDIVSVDVGVILDGWYGDSARTFAVGDISAEKRRLMDVTRESLERGLAKVRNGARLGEVSAAIQEYAESHGFSVVRDLVGHGIGQQMHEEPQVPNYGRPSDGPILKTGMALAIEPMLNLGVFTVNTKADGWTIVTTDNKPSAHFEHTVAVTDDGCDILTVAPVSTNGQAA
ncbi:MAG TPA: type I methionyl aminopeptidase [candidate division Zixibacteria bacterium]|nr:type I methionyl aminopeptidase [candidate division Zixibacteria bacterium]